MGPVCASCGAPAPVAAWGQPPPGAYYGYPGMPGMPGMPYMMAPVPMAPPKKTMAVVAGVLSLCSCALVVLFCAIALANHDFSREDGASGAAGFTIVLTLAAALFSVFSIQGKWWGALTAAILQTVNVIMTLAMIGLCAEAARHARYRNWDSYDTDYNFYGDNDAAKKLESLSGMFALSVIGVLVSMILLYVAIGGAKRWAQYKRHLQAHEAF
jgi:hypothetical protein